MVVDSLMLELLLKSPSLMGLMELMVLLLPLETLSARLPV